MILFPLKLIIEFPPGSTILLPSGTMPHGNTPIRAGETRLSMTQYCAGGLIRWVDYGFQSVKSLLATKDGRERRAAIDGPPGSRWKRALDLFSKVEELPDDRISVFSRFK